VWPLSNPVPSTAAVGLSPLSQPRELFGDKCLSVPGRVLLPPVDDAVAVTGDCGQ
jgi:hypothetical protein